MESKSVDTGSLKVFKKRVRPIEVQEENESRRVWKEVTQSLLKGQIDAATSFKSTLENKQREKAKSRVQLSLEHKTKYFSLNSKTNEWLHVSWLN